MHTELLLAKAVTVTLGLAMAAQAYRGGRHHDSRPMYYLADGFELISIGAVLESPFSDVGGWSILQARSVQTGLVAAEMLLILYARYGSEIR